MRSKLIKLTKSQTAKDTLASSLGQVFGAIGGAIFFAISARLLSVAEFGIFSLSLASAVILKDILGPAINSSLLRFVPSQDNHKSADEFIKYAGLLLIGYFFVTIPFFLLFQRTASLLIFKQVIFGLLPLTLILAVAFSYGSFISGVYQARKQFSRDAVYVISQPVIRLIILALVYYTSAISINSLLLVNITAYFLISTIGLWDIKPTFFSANISKSTRSKTNNFFPPLALSTGLATVTDRASLYITNYLTSAIQVGLLSVVNGLFTPTKQIAGTLNNVLGSRFSSFTHPDQTKSYLFKAISLTSLMALGLASTSLVAKPIIQLIYGSQYLAAVPVFRVFTLAYAVFILQIPFSSLLLYQKGRSDVVAAISVIQFVSTIILNIFFIKSHGLMGAAFAFLLVMILTALSTAFFALTAKKSSHKT